MLRSSRVSWISHNYQELGNTGRKKTNKQVISLKDANKPFSNVWGFSRLSFVAFAAFAELQLHCFSWSMVKTAKGKSNDY